MRSKPIDDEQLLIAHGYDHNWVLDRKDSSLMLAARAIDPGTGRVLDCYTTEPGCISTAEFPRRI